MKISLRSPRLDQPSGITIIIFSFKKAHPTREKQKTKSFNKNNNFSFKKAHPTGEKQKRKFLSKVIIIFSFKKAHPTRKKHKRKFLSKE